MTGKHAHRHAAAGTGASAPDSRPGPTGLRIVVTTRWRQITGAASATAVAFCLVACACSLVAVAGPRAGAQLRTNAFRQLVAATPAADQTVIGTLDAGTLGAALNQQVGASQIDKAKVQLRRNLGRTLPLAPAATDWAGLTTPFSGFLDKSREVGSDSTLLELVYRDNLSKYVRFVAGSLPTGAAVDSARSGVPIAVTTVTAGRFNLRVGSRLVLGSTGIVLRVTGLLAPVRAGAPFWTIDPIAAAPVVVLPPRGEPYWQGGAFISAADVAALQSRFAPSQIQLTWSFPLALHKLTAAQAIRLSQALPNAISSAGQLVFSAFRNVVSVTLSSGAAALVGQFTAQDGAVSNVLDLMSVSLAAVGAAIVLLIAWLMAEQRREEFAVLRARGASRRQLATVVLAGSAIAALPGVAAGAALAVAATPGTSAPLGWWLVGLTALVALVGPVLITVRMHRGYAAISRPDQLPGRMSSARRLIVEAALVLASVGGLIALRHQVVNPRGGDLYASAAPILAAIPVAIVMLRLYPALVQPLLHIAARRPGVTAFLGLARAARVSATAVLPAFAMVLALSLVSFAGMVRGAVIRGEVAAAWQETGADAVISLPNSISAARQRQIAGLPGVQRVVPVAVSLAQSGPGPALTALFADAAQYAALLGATPFGPVPASFASWHARGAGAGPVPVLASAGAAAELGHRAATLNLQYGQRLRVQVVGSAPEMSQIEAIDGPDVRGYVVVPKSLATAYTPLPSTILVVGSSLDGRALTTTVAKWRVAGATVVVRSHLLAALEHAPLQRGAYAELALGGDAAVIGCMLILLLTLMLSGQSRQMTLARASTMGLSATQGRWLALVEALPQILAVLVGGLISALALVPLVGPTLGLSVFTESGSSVAVRIEPAWLAGTAIALLVLAIVTLAGQTVLASRQAPRSLRIGG